MRRYLTCLYGCLIVSLLAGTAAAAQPPRVADFTIVGPLAVITGNSFQIDVIEADSTWQPTAPGEADSVYLSAYDFHTGNSVPISPTSFIASGNGDDIVTVTVDAPIGAWVGIRAQGYGVGPSGPNAPPIMIAGGPGEPAHYFGLSAPMSARPNAPFPIYITPLQGGDSTQVGHPAPFNGTVNLSADIGPISPTSVFLDLNAGESARILVTLSAVSDRNMIHAIAQRQDDGDSIPKYTVEFNNNDQSQINDSSNLKLFPDLTVNDTPLSALGVQVGALWQSMIWPIRKHDDGEGGWNILSFIPGAGLGVQLHTILRPVSVPRDSLPGNLALWYSSVVDTANWPRVSGAFPPGLNGTYWTRHEIISVGDLPKRTTSFINNSPQFDRPLITVNEEGRVEDKPDTLKDIKGTTWHSMIWKTGEIPPTFHVLSSFTISDTIDSQPVMADVQVHGIFVPSIRPRPSFPDSISWNPAYIVNPDSDFADVTGDSLDPDFHGSYWTRLEGVATPDGGDRGGPSELIGWSNEINTTGMHMAGTTIHVDEVFAAPGGDAVLNVRLHSDQRVAGIQFRIEPRHRDGTHAWEATFRGVINDLESQGFSALSRTDQNGVTTILMISLGGGWIEPGDRTVMELVYHIEDRQDLFGTEILVDVFDDILSDPNSQPISHGTWDGVIRIGRPGDLNATGDVNILDIIQEIKYVLGVLPLPDRESFAFFLADLDGNGHLDVLDVVRMINIVLGRATAKPIAGPSGPVRVALGDLQADGTGRSVVPLRARFDGALAGLQFTFTYDPAKVTLGEVLPAASLADMTVDSHAANGTLRLLIYSPEGRVFRASALSTLLSLPVTVQGPESGTLTLAQVVAADPQAQRVPTTITTGTVKVSTLPSAFALKAARPNPFNPTTTIAYEVPQAAHLTLAVYNILGQEVVRLVDGVQTPGRYVVRWDGRNAQGLSVASGVYLYRLTTSTGFTQTRRMTLVK